MASVYVDFALPRAFFILSFFFISCVYLGMYVAHLLYQHESQFSSDSCKVFKQFFCCLGWLILVLFSE